MTTGPFSAFDQAWFTRNQRTLLWLLDASIIGRWFRWTLCIRRSDIGYRKQIVKLMPHAYVIDNHDGTLTAEFRTNTKFARRIYFAFRPVWWILHAWDAAFADRFVPSWSAGLSTLTAYPDSTPTVTMDEDVQNSPAVSDTWANIHNATGSPSLTTNASPADVQILADTTTNKWVNIVRYIATFDTSLIGAGQAVYAASFGLTATGAFDTAPWGAAFDVYRATPAAVNARTASDFSQIGTVSQTTGAITETSCVTDGVTYNTWTFSLVGMNNINVAGVTSLGVTESVYDAPNSPPTWVSGAFTLLQGQAANVSGTSADPVLTATYNTPHLGFPHSHLAAGSGMSVSDQR
jgi:hypothetical protein